MIRYPFELSTTQQNHVGWLDVRQNDTGTQQFVATITTNDVTQDLTGLTAEFRTRQNNENVIIEKATITNEKNGVVEYVVSQYAMQQLGKNIGYFTFSKGDVEMFSTKDFCYYVNTSVTTFGLKGCDYIWRFEDLLEYVTGLANQSQAQLDKLINDVADIQQQIDDMFALIASQGVLSADEVRQLLINFMSGQDIEVTDTFDFNIPSKVLGSVVENPNIARRYVGTVIPPSPPTTNEYGTQAAYDAIKKLEGTLSTQSTNVGVNGSIPWHVISFALVENYKRKYPFIFKGSDAENLTSLKNKLIAIEPMAFAKGTGPSGNTVTAQVYVGNAWTGTSPNNTNSIAKIGFKQVNPTIAPKYIHTDGFCHLVVFSEASNSTVPSTASIDYASVIGTIKVNISDFVATKAQYDALKTVVDTHVADTVKHITAAERASWNAKQPAIGDTGWVKLAFTGGVSSSDCYIRRIGDVVYFKGWLISPAESYDVITLAANFRPALDVLSVVFKDDTGTSKANMQFNADGRMRINYNSNTAARINLGAVSYAI